MFEGQELKSVGPDGVLVPSSTWKAVYDPRAGGAGAYVCTNTATPSCDVVSVAALVRTTGVDPFPSLPSRIKGTAVTLPPPEDGPYASGGQRWRQEHGLLE